jgi:hypothetical protein
MYIFCLLLLISTLLPHIPIILYAKKLDQDQVVGIQQPRCLSKLQDAASAVSLSFAVQLASFYSIYTLDSDTGVMIVHLRIFEAGALTGCKGLEENRRKT